jgi:hypothetical protein
MGRNIEILMTSTPEMFLPRGFKLLIIILDFQWHSRQRYRLVEPVCLEGGHSVWSMENVLG